MRRPHRQSDDDDSAELVHVFHLQSENAISVLMKYFEQSDLAIPNDLQPLSEFKHHMN